MTVAEATPETQPLPPPTRRRSSRREALARATAEDRVVDYQAQMDELASANVKAARGALAEIQEDEADDNRRLSKYRAVEHAIRTKTTEIQLVTFHELVAHIEADEFREDKRRRGRVGAERLLALKALQLRRIFRDDFVPLIRAAYVKGGRA